MIEQRDKTPIDDSAEPAAPAYEHFPDRTIVLEIMSSVTAKIAACAKNQILNIHATGVPAEKKDRIAIIDTAAAAVMEQELIIAPFSVSIVGSEGAKEQHPDKMGKAMPTVIGLRGNRGGGMVCMVNDVVEGTTAAALNIPGAISVVAVSRKDGLMPTPENTYYMDKLFAPPKAAGKVHIEAAPQDNIATVCDVYGIPLSKADELTVVILNRPRNAHIIEAVQRFGARLKIIERGDLVPSLLAILPPENHTKGVHMVMGIGGWEEGVIAAAAARSIDGVVEGRAWSEDAPNQPRLTLDTLVPGESEHTMAIYSMITDDPWFGIGGATPKNGAMLVETVIINSSGLSIVRHSIPDNSHEIRFEHC